MLPTTSKMFSILFVSCLETQLIEMLTLPSCGLTVIFIVEVCDCVGWLACILLLLQLRGWGRPVTGGTLSGSHVVSPEQGIRDIPLTLHHPTEFILIIKYFPEYSVTVNYWNTTKLRQAPTWQDHDQLPLHLSWRLTRISKLKTWRYSFSNLHDIVEIWILTIDLAT